MKSEEIDYRVGFKRLDLKAGDLICKYYRRGEKLTLIVSEVTCMGRDFADSIAVYAIKDGIKTTEYLNKYVARNWDFAFFDQSRKLSKGTYGYGRTFKCGERDIESVIEDTKVSKK